MKPTEHKNPYYGVQSEIIHAMSSLNMEPERLDNPAPDAFYLSELDKCANHSMEHLYAAMNEVGRIHGAQTSIQRIVFACLHLLRDGDTDTVNYILGELATSEIFYNI